ncbi:MAG: UDP-galactopyranose mutase [Candidatus Omnitrophica bacterium]|nr:UDP-galactopyranose mutase [Candidatus Omnitrophota bacterium]
MKYDYLVVGAGLFGSVFAHEAKSKGKKVIVLERRGHIGGNCYSYDFENTGINIPKYGAHIFHTTSKEIWDYFGKYAQFNRYQHRVLTTYKDKVYSMPINLSTINNFYGVNLRPFEVDEFMRSTRYIDREPDNFEDKAVSLIGKELYEAFIKGYTVKQWDCMPKDLPKDIMGRLPVRNSFFDSYYNDNYQGMPIGGYTPIFSQLLEGVEVILNTDFFAKRAYWESISDNIVFTGPVDRFYDYKCGKLRWRSLKFEIERLNLADYQGTSVMNYPEIEIPYTRIIEPKHFYRERQIVDDCTVIIRELPISNDDEPYYPVNLDDDRCKYSEYAKMQKKETNVIFGGRLAEYKYYDMDQVVSAALNRSRESLR